MIIKQSVTIIMCLLILSCLPGCDIDFDDYEKESWMRAYDERQKRWAIQREKMKGLALNDNMANWPAGSEEAAHYEDEPEQTDVGAGNNIIKIFEIGNLEQVYNGGTPPTFILDKPYHVTELWTYHWNDGRGAPAGTLALKTNDGQNFGPWQVRLHNEVYWVADINRTIPPGEYTVIDSDPSTLSQNASTGGQGMSWMFGYPAQ